MRLGCRSIVLLAALITFAVPAAPAHAWDPRGHTMITAHAIELLPAEIKPFYEANARYVEALVALPDDWRETHKETGPDHYLNMDSLDSPPFTRIRGTREEAEKRFGKEKLREAGLLPWVIEERCAKLADAMKSGSPERIVVQSALLAHYVGDAHVPFHATKDYDGRKPEQKGLHFRWETSLVAMRLKPESIKPRKAADASNVVNASFDWLAASYSYVDSICAADDRAREKDPGHGYRYHKMLADETLGILESRMSSAAEDLAGVYVAAWQRAGKPALTDKPAPLYWGM